MKKNAKDQQKTVPGPSARRPVARLVERVALRVQKRTKAARTVNRALVVVLKEEIREALLEGFSVKDVWETLSEEGAVAFGYQAFRRHVNRVVPLKPIPSVQGRAAPSRPPSAPAARVPASPSKSTAATKAAATPRAGIAGFIFDPIPKKEDLI